MEKILSENNFIRKLILDNILISRATIFESIALAGRDFNSANVQRITGQKQFILVLGPLKPCLGIVACLEPM